MFNFKKIKELLAMLIIVIILMPGTVYGESMSVNINKDQLSNGIVKINYESLAKKRSKVMISKGAENYTYDLKSEGNFPLQFGNGDYKILVLENVTGNQYRVIKSKNINLNIDNKNAVYLQSIDMIKWNNEMKAIKKAKEITKYAKTDLEKSKIIYDYITQNIKYDNHKANTIQTGYIPSVDQTLTTASGICFDYAVLYAAMMRSVNIPTKMVMGYNKDIASYHSWNEVYLKETDKWVTIDTTYDANSVQSGNTMPMIKNNKDYKIEKIY